MSTLAKEHSKILLLILLTANLSILLVKTIPVSGKESLPPINVGDEWVFYEVWEPTKNKSIPLVVTVTVQKTERFRGYEAYVIDYRAESSISGGLVYTLTRWITADWLELKQVSSFVASGNVTSTLIPNPAMKLIEAPLEVGKSWSLDTVLEVSTTNESRTTQNTVRYDGIRCTVTSIADVEVISGHFRAYLIEQRHSDVLQSRRWVSFETESPPLILAVSSIVKYEEYSQDKVTMTGELVSYRSKAVGADNLRIANFEFNTIFGVAFIVVVAYAVYTIQKLVRHPQLRRSRHNLLKPVGYLFLMIGTILTFFIILIYFLVFNSPLIISAVLLNILEGYSLKEWSALFLSLGLTPLIFVKLRYNPVFLAASSAVGILMILATLKLIGYILTLQGTQYFFWLLMSTDIIEWGIGPGLVAGGVLTYLLVSKDWETISGKNTRVFDYTVVGTTIFATAFAFSSAVTIRIFGLAAFTWIVWQFVTPKLVAVWVAGITSDQRAKTSSRYIFYKEPRKPIPFKASGVFRRSILPLQMAFGTIPMMIKLLNLAPKALGDIDSAFQIAGTLVRIAWFVIPTIIFVAGPLEWIFEESGIRRCDRLTRAYNDLSLGLFEEFVGIGSLISLLDFSYDASNKNIEMTILLAFLIVIVLLPITLLATALYVRISINKHIIGFIECLRQLGMEVVTVDTATVEQAEKAPHHTASDKPDMLHGESQFEYCINCGEKVLCGSRFCRKCGERLS
jgi:hypothetical protein